MRYRQAVDLSPSIQAFLAKVTRISDTNFNEDFLFDGVMPAPVARCPMRFKNGGSTTAPLATLRLLDVKVR